MVGISPTEKHVPYDKTFKLNSIQAPGGEQIMSKGHISSNTTCLKCLKSIANVSF